MYRIECKAKTPQEVAAAIAEELRQRAQRYTKRTKTATTVKQIEYLRGEACAYNEAADFVEDLFFTGE